MALFVDEEIVNAKVDGTNLERRRVVFVNTANMIHLKRKLLVI
jgi:hypothetical protein